MVSTKPQEPGGLTFALQALLDRHESYMAESEKERRTMAASIEQLEEEKRSLKAVNARVVQENEELQQQLEGLNTQVVDSDAHIASLMATLSSAHFENKRLTALALRTAELEAQLTAMEMGQLRLQEELTTTQEDERSAIYRWKHAETRLRDLNDQIYKIEREAQDEREKHVEIMGRMERQRNVERELESAAGRLKGAAAASTLSRDKNGTNVVSHFVRDILKDNANLQAGIVELRDLLQTSNEEVQTLRDLVLQHQPISNEQEPQPPSLMDEMLQNRPQVVSPEVHVHHHYHAKITAKRERAPSFRRPPKRRGLVSSSTNSSLGCQTPIPRPGPQVLSMPYQGNKISRWSTQSSATDFSNVSSLPSSPCSDHRSSSIFDRIKSGFESSQPTSPESAGFAPSSFRFERRKSQSESKVISLTDVSEDEPPSRTLRVSGKRQCADVRRRVQTGFEAIDIKTGLSPRGLSSDAAFVASEHPLPVSSSFRSDHDPNMAHATQGAITINESYLNSPRLRRSTSQESLVSISGMDIHLPQHRNSRPCLRPRPSSTFKASDPLNLSIAFPLPQPLASIAEVHASSSNLTSPSNADLLSPVSLLSDLASGKSPQPGAKGLGQLVGSWVRGRWGIAPTASTGNLREQAALSDSFARMPGINQKGPIVGWKPPERTPSEVHVKVLDEILLKESLVE